MSLLLCTGEVGQCTVERGGTLLLDEVDEMPPAMQVKLLRFLGEGTFLSVSGRAAKRADVRVIAAIHRDLAAMVAEGSFREGPERLHHKL